MRSSGWKLNPALVEVEGGRGGLAGHLQPPRCPSSGTRGCRSNPLTKHQASPVCSRRLCPAPFGRSALRPRGSFPRAPDSDPAPGKASPRRFEKRAEPAHRETPSFSVKPSDTSPSERAPHSAWGSRARRRGGAPGAGGGPGGAGRSRRPQRGRGGARRCGGCSGTSCRRTLARRSREAQGPAGPRRPPDGPACPSVEGGRASRRAPRARRGACAARGGVYLGRAPAPSPSPSRRRPDKDAQAPAAQPALAKRGSPGTRAEAAPSEPFVRPGRWRFGEWLGRDTSRGLGMEGRGGPLASAETWGTAGPSERNRVPVSLTPTPRESIFKQLFA